jgi:hypothetical protein
MPPFGTGLAQTKHSQQKKSRTWAHEKFWSLSYFHSSSSAQYKKMSNTQHEVSVTRRKLKIKQPKITYHMRVA